MAEKPLSRRQMLRSAGAGGLALLLPGSARAQAFSSRAVKPAENVVLRWNDALLQGVRNSKLGPPMVSRALAIAHTAIFDAWAAYDGTAVGTRLGGALRRPVRERSPANKDVAISFAAYRAAVDLFPGDKAAVFDPLMASLGFERRAALADRPGRLRQGRLPRAVPAADRPQRRTHRRGKDDRRILGGRASLRAAAGPLESVRTAGLPPRPHRRQRTRPRPSSQALLRAHQRDLRRGDLRLGQQARLRLGAPDHRDPHRLPCTADSRMGRTQTRHADDPRRAVAPLPVDQLPHTALPRI